MRGASRPDGKGATGRRGMLSQEPFLQSQPSPPGFFRRRSRIRYSRLSVDVDVENLVLDAPSIFNTNCKQYLWQPRGLWHALHHRNCLPLLCAPDVEVATGT